MMNEYNNNNGGGEWRGGKLKYSNGYIILIKKAVI